MNERQAYAYAYPLTDPRGVVFDSGYFRNRRHGGTGVMIRTALAIDR